MEWEADGEQARVLEHGAGALVVTGPPGSGKSLLLRERFARLVEAGAAADRVLLLVLNRRAARDAREHLMRRLARSVPDLPVLTAHGFGFRIVGRRFADLGYEAPPQVLSAAEQYAAVREMLREESPGEWPGLGHLLGVPGFAREVADFVLRAQERLLAPDDLEPLAGDRDEYRGVVGFYRRYLDALLAAGQVDFAGLLLQTARVLEEGAAAYDHVLVDDYQDATHAAEAILRALAGRAQSAVVAADPGGHVFSYRGGSLEPYARLDETLGSPARVRLTASHRLGVGEAALRPLDDPSAPPLEAPPPWLEARLLAHPGEEAEAAAHELLRLRVDEDVPWERTAVVLRRYGGYLTAIRHALARHGIPFVVVAEEAAVAQEPANRPVLDLLRYAFREDRRDDLLEGLLTSPLVGLDPHDVRRLRREARARGRSPRDLVEEAPPEDLPEDLRDRLTAFRDLAAEIPGVAAARGPDGAFFWLWSRVPAFGRLVASEAGRRDLDALAALGDVLARFVERRPGATVEDYLDAVEAAEFGPDPWVLPEERHPRAVRIISAHRAQGLEFDAVVVAGCLEGEFPSLGHRYPVVDLEALVAPASPRERVAARLAEERALFRLAVTRARRRTLLLASSSSGASDPRTPSRFAERLGLRWEEGPAEHGPATSLRTLEASLRRTLADREAPPGERLAALAGLASIGARPETWWGWREWTDPGVPLHEGELRTSYSRLSTLQNCGLQYLYEVEMGLDPDPTHQMWTGSLVHDLIDRVQRGELPRDEDAMVAALDEAWDPNRFPSRAVAHRRYLDARDMIHRWLTGEASDPVRSEVGFSFEVDGAVMRGRIDAIFRMENGHLRIVDYKTSRSPIRREEVKEDLQLAAYYLAVKRDEDLAGLGPPGYLQLAYLGKADSRTTFARRQFSPGTVPGYEEWAESTIRDLLGRVRAEDFAPSPEAECRFCSFKTICPLWPEGREVPV